MTARHPYAVLVGFARALVLRAPEATPEAAFITGFEVGAGYAINDIEDGRRMLDSIDLAAHDDGATRRREDFIKEMNDAIRGVGRES